MSGDSCAQRLERRLKQLESSVANLNEVTDEVTARISQLEERLRSSNPGTEKYLFDQPVVDQPAGIQNPDGSEDVFGCFLGWSKSGESSRWEFVVWYYWRNRPFRDEAKFDSSRVKMQLPTQALLSASREIKIAALPKIGLLLEKLHEEVGRLTTDARKGLEEERS